MESRKNKPGRHKDAESFAIENALRTARGFRINNVNVMMADDEVVLRGTTRSLNDKLKAADLVKGHPNAQGKTISNQIQVVTT